MQQALIGIILTLLLACGFLFYKNSNLQSNIQTCEDVSEVQENNIKNLESNITNTNKAIETIKVDVIKNKIIYVDKVKTITNTITVEKEKELLKDMNFTEDCKRAKEISLELFN